MSRTAPPSKPSSRRRHPASGVRTRPACTAPVLVVEDDASQREAIGSLISSETGHRVEEAGDGREALELLRRPGQRVPCMIVTDLVMPRMSGWQLIEVLAASPIWRAIPVIVLSASLDAEPPALLGQALGLHKPVSADELVGIVTATCPRGSEPGGESRGVSHR